MTQAQATVTGFIRITGIMTLIFLIGTFRVGTTEEIDPKNMTPFPSNLKSQINMYDFAGGTVIHINVLGLLAILLCILLIVFSKKIAILITPKT